MRILAVDTATEASSVALLSSATTSLRDAHLVERHEELGKSHARQILGMVDAVLAEAQMSLSMLDGIAASIGPGAFTGVRISVAVAQGLAFGAGLPVVPVSTLEALALQALQGGATHALACLDARMGEVYWGCFAADVELGLRAEGALRVGPPDTVMLPHQARAPVRPILADTMALPGGKPPLRATRALAGDRYCGIGRGFAAYPLLAALPGLEISVADSSALPRAREFAWLGALRLAAGSGLDPADITPLYLRDKVAMTEAERAQAKAR